MFVRFIAALLAVIAVTAATASSQTTPGVVVSVSGTVSRVDGASSIPVDGDTIVVLSYLPTGSVPQVPVAVATTVTDSAGRYGFYGLALSGTYQVSAMVEQQGTQGAASFDVRPGDAGKTFDVAVTVEASGERGPPGPATYRFKSVKVFYATDRQAGPSDAIGVDYKDLRSAPYLVSLGVAHVSIPEGHVRGQIEGLDIRLDLKADKSKKIVIESVQSLETGTFYEELRGDVATKPEKRILVYLHGFQTGFDWALRTAAQIKYDLTKGAAPVDVAMVFYSWPSHHSLSVQGYFADMDESSNTAGSLEAFLVDLAARNPGTQVSVVAHSMGNRALTAALLKIAASNGAKPPVLAHVIMAAPDIPASQLAADSCKLASITRSITLYASAHDQALWAASFLSILNGGQRVIRAGFADPLLLARGLDTVDASTAVTDFVGHTYFASDVNILDDIQDTLNNDPMPRQHLVDRSQSAKPFWLYVAAANKRAAASLVLSNRCT